jgi:tRNA pseudouridine38-40 synthase
MDSRGNDKRDLTLRNRLFQDQLTSKDVMRNLKLTLHYEGTQYQGWQSQGGKRGPTIQDVVADKVEKITAVRAKIIGAGRTDAGVHAKGQVANFRTEHTIDCNSLLRALNSIPPYDIIVSSVEEVPEDFHAQYWALEKHYQYRILNRAVPDPFDSRFSWHLRCTLDLEKMRDAAHFFIGEKDFSSFCGAKCGAKTTRRHLKELKITRNQSIITLDCRGNGFLRHMVRNIVGTLVDVGKGRIIPEDIENIFAACDRRQAGPTAPAQGLFLMKITY